MEFRIKMKSRDINLEVTFISMIFEAMGLDQDHLVGKQTVEGLDH